MTEYPQDVLNVFLGGKTLQELNFPADWIYDLDKAQWYSENHFLTITPATSERETGSKYGTPYKQYLYITDKMLSNLSGK